MRGKKQIKTTLTAYLLSEWTDCWFNSSTCLLPSERRVYRHSALNYNVQNRKPGWKHASTINPQHTVILKQQQQQQKLDTYKKVV